MHYNFLSADSYQLVWANKEPVNGIARIKTITTLDAELIKDSWVSIE
jgi:hypothetical protein